MKVANQDSSNTLIYWMKRHSPALRIISVTVYYLIGITFYHITEDWTYIDSAFFVTSSVATIGYGEVHPTNDVGRLFTAFYILAGLAIVLTAVDDLARYIAVRLETSLMEYMLPGNSLLVRLKC